jgi:hypothetical protein
MQKVKKTNKPDPLSATHTTHNVIWKFHRTSKRTPYSKPKNLFWAGSGMGV